MSTELDTTIELYGTTEERVAMLRVLKFFENEKLEQYSKKGDCGYLENVQVTTADESRRILRMTDDELTAFVSEAGDELTVDAEGPYGHYWGPEDVGVFEALADAAPKASFKGCISGYVHDGDVRHCGELKNGLLYLSDYTATEETFLAICADYIDSVKEKLPYADFCELFLIDNDKFDDEQYSDFIMYSADYGSMSDVDYNSFADFCKCSEINEEQYKNAMAKVSGLKIKSYDDFCFYIDKDKYSEKRIYDPAAKAYEKLTK